MANSKPELHVILGAGQVGPILAEKLVVLGHEVRTVSRTRPRPVPGASWLQGDLTDRTFARAAVRGASVVYHCANPMRYDQWEMLLPALSKGVNEAVAGTGARLVVLDNLYMYGSPEAGVIRDDSPLQPQSRKGELRAQISNDFFAAQARGAFELSVARAADFFGPHAGRTVIFNPMFFARLARDKAAPVLGDPDLPHAHVYMRDVAEALLLLGTRPKPSTQPWLLPVTWNGSTRALFEIFGRIADRRATAWRVPAWLWPVIGAWNPEARGIPEMLHQWNAPFTVDDSRFRREFGVSTTPVERAVLETLQAYGMAAQRSAAPIAVALIEPARP
jgi:nucleoside-diphosphate-sugar epimerase